MRTRVFLRPEDKSIDVAYEGDVSATLENNARLRSMPQKSDCFKHVASVPHEVIMIWLNEVRARGYNMKYLSQEFNELVNRKLQDPDWKHLRTDK